jgi:hypothetical protein
MDTTDTTGATGDSLATAGDQHGGDLGRELIASVLLVVLMLATTVLFVGGILGAVWLFG